MYKKLDILSIDNFIALQCRCRNKGLWPSDGRLAVFKAMPVQHRSFAHQAAIRRAAVVKSSGGRSRFIFFDRLEEEAVRPETLKRVKRYT